MTRGRLPEAYFGEGGREQLLLKLSWKCSRAVSLLSGELASQFIRTPTDFVWPQWFCSYQLCSLIKKKKIKSHLDGITMQHLSEKQTALANVMVMKQLLLNRNQTQNKTKKNPQLLWFCSLGIGYFGEGKKRVNLDGKECSSKVTHFFS